MRKVDEIFNSMVGKGGAYTGFCDWIASDGRGQYIDTGDYLMGSDEIEIEWLEYSGTSFFFGASNETALSVVNSNMSYYVITPNAHTYCGYGVSGSTPIMLNSRQANTPMSLRSQVVDGRMVFVLTRLSDSVAYTASKSVASFTTTRTMALFGIHLLDRVVGNVNIFKMGRFLKKRNGVVVQDFRPYVDNGIGGMLDVVNDVFSPSANGVNFLYGNF